MPTVKVINKAGAEVKELTLCDVGTGAGFPGIPLSIMNPTLKITLVDSLNKRLIFLQEVVNKLNLKNVEADIEVTGKDCVGGIVGKIGYAEKLDTLFDQIMGNSGTKYSTIGINILESTNHGTITSIGECAGGIVGAFYDKSGSINNCNNYGAINAANLDGGTSTALTENHQYVNNPWNGRKRTIRSLPNAWIVVK